MYVERVLSFNGGWSILAERKNDEWREIANALKTSGDAQLKNGTQSASIHYAMYSLDFQAILKEQEWAETQTFNIQSNLTKNRVFATVLGVEGVTGSNFATEFYLNAPQRYQVDAIDVSVLLIPTSDVITHFAKISGKPSQAATLPTEEFCQAEMAKFGPLNNQAPIVLAIFSPIAPAEIIVEEVIPLKVSAPTIERTLEFAPEYYQASVGLLAYFGKVLREKDPQTKAKVRIEQDGNIVRLHIESSSGDIETIEERLEQYALIINKQAPPESLFDNPGQIIELKAQLRVAQMQVETAHDLKQLSDGRITSLEKQVEFLQTQFAAQILQTDKVIDIVGRQNDSHERVQTALLTHSGILFKDLLQEASGNQQLLQAVGNLHQNLLAGITTIEIEDQLERALSTIKENKPGFLGRIVKELEGAAYKASASSAISWVIKWVAAHA